MAGDWLPQASLVLVVCDEMGYKVGRRLRESQLQVPSGRRRTHLVGEELNFSMVTFKLNGQTGPTRFDPEKRPLPGILSTIQDSLSVSLECYLLEI